MVGAVVDIVLGVLLYRKEENWQDKERRIQKEIKQAMTKKKGE